MNINFETKYYNSNTLARINHVIKLSHDYAIKFKSSKDFDKFLDRFEGKANKLIQELNFTDCEIAMFNDFTRYFGLYTFDTDSVEVPWLKNPTLAENMEKYFKEWTENGSIDCLTNPMFRQELAYDLHLASTDSYQTVNLFMDFPFYATFEAFCHAYDSEHGDKIYEAFKIAYYAQMARETVSQS